MTLGAIIKDYRTKAGYTQKDLADKLGYEIPQFISLMENGHSKIPLNILGEIIAILNIPEKKVIEVLLENFEKEARVLISNGRKKAVNS